MSRPIIERRNDRESLGAHQRQMLSRCRFLLDSFLLVPMDRHPHHAFRGFQQGLA